MALRVYLVSDDLEVASAVTDETIKLRDTSAMLWPASGEAKSAARGRAKERVIKLPDFVEVGDLF